MIQFFVEKEYQSIFQEGTVPKLVSVSKIDSDYTIHPRMLHCHEDQLEVLFVRSGSGVYIIDNVPYDIAEGDVLISNSNILHDEVSEKSRNLNTYCITMKDVKIKGLPDNCLCGMDMIPCNPSNEYKDMLEMLYKSVYTLVATGDGDLGAANYIALSILSLTYFLTYEGNKPSTREYGYSNILGKKIKQYIDTHYDQNLTLTELADIFHLSPYHVSHVFKETIGYSPIQYMLRRRIGEAQNLLIYTNHSITTIASMVGYDNPSHFNNMFVKNVKMSPGEYRKNYTNKK